MGGFGGMEHPPTKSGVRPEMFEFWRLNNVFLSTPLKQKPIKFQAEV